MNNPEFSRAFDLLYDNASSGAPGINEYEKSEFFTLAQWDIFKKYIDLYKTSDRARTVLDKLVDNHSIDFDSALNSALSTKALSNKSYYFQLPLDTQKILQEQVRTSELPCTNQSLTLEVVPVMADDYNVVAIKDPFSRPNDRRALSLDFRVEDISGTDTKVLEIIYNHSLVSVASYQCRYIKSPTPIVLTDIESDPELQGLDLTIEGVNISTQTLLNEVVHEELLNRAVDLAVLAYRENQLNNRVAINRDNSV